MKHITKLAVVGSGVVGGGVLHTWHHRGYHIVGYDVNQATIDTHRAKGLACEHMDQFINCQADMVFICISTPQSDDGSIYLDYMRSGLQTVGPWLAKRVSEGHYPMVVMRSTMLPKLSEREIIPQLETHSQLKAGHDFGYAFMPEILRETDANEDEANIWQVVIGAMDKRTGDMLVQMITPELGEGQEKLVSVVPIAVAEASKIIVNTYNATIISYFNQMGLWLNSMDIDSQQAIDLAMRMCEGSLNRWYGTATGFPYGGKCLPKDVAAVLSMAKDQNMTMPQLAATQQVNNILVDMAAHNRVPKPIKGGFRRMSASMLRQQALAAYEQYRTLTGAAAPVHPHPQTAQARQKAHRLQRALVFMKHWGKTLRQRFVPQPRLGA